MSDKKTIRPKWHKSEAHGPYIIAEAGVNHNGSLDRACEMVRIASAFGADAIKFQTFKADKLVTRSAPKADYQNKATGDAGTQWDLLKRLELSDAAFRQLTEECKSTGIDFLSTPFDEESLRFLVDSIGVDKVKLGSGELTNGPLLHAVAKTGLPVILSTGMGTTEEVRGALAVLAHGYSETDTPPSQQAFIEAIGDKVNEQLLCDKVAILHCTSAYPTPVDELNLNVIETLRDTFSLPVGFSDHSTEIAPAVAATALGISVLEKHFTLNRELPGPDHAASLIPDEMAEMIKMVRQAATAIGDGNKTPASAEVNNMPIVRKSLVAARKVQAGEKFTPDNVTVKRPGIGISPMLYWETLGTIAKRDFEEDEVIKP